MTWTCRVEVRYQKILKINILMIWSIWTSWPGRFNVHPNQINPWPLIHFLFPFEKGKKEKRKDLLIFLRQMGPAAHANFTFYRFVLTLLSSKFLPSPISIGRRIPSEGLKLRQERARASFSLLLLFTSVLLLFPPSTVHFTQ